MFKQISKANAELVAVCFFSKAGVKLESYDEYYKNKKEEST